MTEALDVEPAAARADRRRRLVVAGVVLVVAALLGWLLFRPDVGLLRDDHGLTLAGFDVGDPGGFGITVPSARADTYSLGAVITVCLRAGVERAVVDDVTVDAGDLRVTDVAVRKVPGGPHAVDGGPYGTLRDLGFGGSTMVTGQCADKQYSDVGVQFVKPTPATARADGLVVHWHAGGRSGELHVAAHLVLCEGPDTSVPECDPEPDPSMTGP
jgi:hypothetical protein